MSPIVILAAFFGTVAFAILYDIPTRYCFVCGISGMIGWIIYAILLPILGNMPAIFIATIGISLISIFFAVWQKCPEIVFLVSGIFPIVPGAGIYWTAYYLVAGNMSLAADSGSSAFKTCLAMVLGIAIVHELPQKFFSFKRNLK